MGETAVVVLALGLFYAATDGVLMAIASSMLPESSRATGLSLVVTATSIGRLLASVVFGAAWTLVGVDTAVVIFAGALTLAGIGSAIVFNRQQARAATAG
jgi:MFS family permease